MAYFHSLKIKATLKPQVAKSQIVQALSPIGDFLHITPNKLLNGFCDDYDSFEWDEWQTNENSFGTTFILMTQGEVGSGLTDAVHKASENLLELIEPAYFTLSEINDELTKIWIGQGPELELAQREEAIEQCMSVLAGTLDSNDQYAIADQIRQARLPSEREAPTLYPTCKP